MGGKREEEEEEEKSKKRGRGRRNHSVLFTPFPQSPVQSRLTVSLTHPYSNHMKQMRLQTSSLTYIFFY